MIDQKHLTEVVNAIKSAEKFNTSLNNIPFGMKLAYAIGFYRENGSLDEMHLPNKMEDYLNPSIEVEDNVGSFTRNLGDLTQCETASGFKAFVDKEKITLPEATMEVLSNHLNNINNLRGAANEYSNRFTDKQNKGRKKTDQTQLQSEFNQYIDSQNALGNLNFKSEIYGIDQAINELITRQNSGKTYTSGDILHNFAININQPHREIEEAKQKIDTATTPDKKNQLEREYVKTVLNHQVAGNIPIPQEMKVDILQIRDSRDKNREVNNLTEKICGEKRFFDKFMEAMQSVFQLLGIGEDYYREKEQIENLKVVVGIKNPESPALSKQNSLEKDINSKNEVQNTTQLNQGQNIVKNLENGQNQSLIEQEKDNKYFKPLDNEREKILSDDNLLKNLDNERQKLSSNKPPETSALKQKTPKYVSQEAQGIITGKEINDENLMSVKYSFETKSGRTATIEKLILKSYQDNNAYQQAKDDEGKNAKQNPDYQEAKKSDRGSINFKDFEVQVCCLMSKDNALIKLIEPKTARLYNEICEKNNYEIKHFTLPVDIAIDKFKGELQFCNDNPTKNPYAPEDIAWLEKRVKKCESLKSIESEIKDMQKNIKVDDKSIDKSHKLNEIKQSRSNEL